MRRNKFRVRIYNTHHMTCVMADGPTKRAAFTTAWRKACREFDKAHSPSYSALFESAAKLMHPCSAKVAGNVYSRCSSTDEWKRGTVEIERQHPNLPFPA